VSWIWTNQMLPSLQKWWFILIYSIALNCSLCTQF
jgi:hypothetical protein